MADVARVGVQAIVSTTNSYTKSTNYATSANPDLSR
jgi:hypothetical protein